MNRLNAAAERVRVTLIATPETQAMPLIGLYETLTSFELLSQLEPDLPPHPFDVVIAGPGDPPVYGANGFQLATHARLCDIGVTDVVVIPLMLVSRDGWVTGRYPEVVDWLRARHVNGSRLCSVCTGVLLLAETGLLDGRDATIHWAFADMFSSSFPAINLRVEEALITAGEREEFVLTGGVMSWQDLALELIARHVGATAAQAMARLLMLEWHGEGQAPYVDFVARTDHADALVRELQRWLQKHYMVLNPVEELAARSGLQRRSLERRFRKATGRTPIEYVQAMRIAEARRRLERTDISVEKIGLQVGYENTAFFRRVFKRATHMTPGAYRRKFQLTRLRG